MEPPKSDSYYFPGVPHVERAAVPDDEFDGCMVDERFLEKLVSVAPEWRDAIVAAQAYGTVELEETQYSSLYVQVTRITKIHPAAKQWEGLGFWHEDISSARKRGWDWSGDTDVSVRTVNAQGVQDLLLSYLLARGMVYVRKDLPLRRKSAESWAQFWELGFGSLEHNLPAWGGKPTDVIFLVSDGNSTVVAGEKGLGTYHVVEFMTS